MKKSSKRKLKEKVWKYFSEYIRLRDGYECVMCGKRKDEGHVIQAGHVIPAHYGLYWKFKENDVFAQCYSCNSMHTRDTKPYYDWFIERFGQAKFNEFWNNRHLRRKYAEWEYQEMIEEYQDKINKLIFMQKNANV